MTSNVFAQSCEEFKSELKLGSKGEEVTQLQKFLVAGRTLTTSNFGYFGPATKSAILKFQKNNNLKQTGNFDRNTLVVANKRCNVLVNIATSTTSSIRASSTVQVSDSFKLEITSDKYTVEPDGQIIFNVKLTNVGTTTYKDIKLGLKKCSSDDFDLNADLKFDGISDFWATPLMGNGICNQKIIGNFITDFKLGDSYTKSFAYKNFATNPNNTILNPGKVTEGVHTANASYSFSVNGKQVNIKSNELKFYTKTKNKENINVKVMASVDKKLYKKGEQIKMLMTLKNIGKEEVNFSSYNGNCVPSYVEFLIDGFHSNLQFFVEKPNDIRCFNLMDPLNFINIKIMPGEEKVFSLNGSMPQFIKSDDNYLIKKLKGTHTLQAKFYYPDALVGYREFKSDPVKFEVVLD